MTGMVGVVMWLMGVEHILAQAVEGGRPRAVCT